MGAVQPNRIRRWLSQPLKALGSMARRARTFERRPVALGLLFVLGLGAGFSAARLASQGAFSLLAGGRAWPWVTRPQALRAEPGARAVDALPLPQGDSRPQESGQAPGRPGPATLSRGPQPGTLLWPADGLIVSVAGWRRHPERGDWTYQPGLELAVASGAPVRAAADGTVTELALRPDGYTLTVDHGGGWTTTYGRLGAVRVKQGAALRRGDVLGYGPRASQEFLPAISQPGGATSRAASSPASQGPEGPAALISFEVRQGGESMDPMRVMEPGWFRVRSEEGARSETIPQAAPWTEEEEGGAAMPVPGP